MKIESINLQRRKVAATRINFAPPFVGAAPSPAPRARHAMHIPVFQLNSVRRYWGDRIAVQDINLRINPGEIIALIGPSGGGKSTLINLLAGALRPTGGQVRIDGTDLALLSPRPLRRHRARCGIIEQAHLLVPQMSVHQNIIAGCLSEWSWYKVTASALWHLETQRVTELLEVLGLENLQWERVSTLSGGQMQRVAVARALINNPGVILADEPTASLDPNTARAVTALICEQARLRGATLVFSTHWLDIVRDRCDRVLGLRHGRVVLDAAPRDVSESALQMLYQGSGERI